MRSTRLPKGVNVGGMVGHCALRHYAMGERGLDEAPATDDDIATMRDLVDEAMARGRARLLDLAHAAAPRSRRPARPRNVGRRTRAPRDRRRARARTARASTRSRRASNVPARTTKARAPKSTGWPRSTGAPADRHLRARAEQRGARAVPQDPRPRRRRSRARRRAPPADHRARHRPALRAAAPHVLRPRRRRGRRCNRCRSTNGSPRSTTTVAAPSCSPTPTANTPPLDWNGVFVLTADRVDYSADPATSLAAHAAGARRDDPEAFVRISLETAAGRCSTSRSSTSGWTRSRSCSTTRGWPSASATRARTSA